MLKPIILLQPAKTTEANNPPKALLKRIDDLFMNDGSSEDYINVFHEIPDSNKDLRGKFFCRIYRKAKQERWSIERFGNIMNVIG